jgi:hypothetical protein
LLPAGAVAGWDLHPLESAAFPRHTPKAVIDANLNLIAHKRCGIAALMNCSVCIVHDMIMTRFGWAVEDVVR